MTVKKLIKILLDECRGDTTMQVKLDADRPIPLEEVFSIQAGKSWLLFKNKIQRKI